MAKRDLYSNIALVTSVVPAAQTALVNGTGIDLRGFNSAAIGVTTGAIVSAGLFGVKLQESDDNSTYTDVAAGDYLGTAPTALAASSTYWFGYKGTKRYVRAVVTYTSGTSIVVGVVVIKGHPDYRPTA